MFAEPFDLLKFPKISGNSYTNVPLVCIEDHLFLGVSGSSVNKLTVVPPQVLSAHSVAPGTFITAILADGASVKAYATSERGKFHLKVLSAIDDNNDEVATSIDIEEEIAGLYISTDKTRIATVGRNTSNVRTYLTEGLQEVSAESGLEFGKCLFTAQLANDQIAETIFTQLCQLESGIVFKIYVLDKSARCLKSTQLEIPANFSISTARWTQHGSNLYAIGSNQVLIYKIPDGVLVSSFELDGSGDVTGFIALPHNNIALSRSSTIELVDCSFEARVASTKVPGHSNLELLGYSDHSSTLIALSDKKNLIGISVTPTSGTLLESIGKGRPVSSSSEPTISAYPLTDIFGGFEEPQIDYEKNLLESKEEIAACLKDLETCVENRDGASFSRIVTYLKNAKLNWIHDADKIVQPTEEDLVFEESDRVADVELIRSVCKMVFVPRFQTFIPIGVALYLLTHPLFPVTDSAFRKMLKTLEKSDSMLYRQALVSLTGLTVEDLVVGLLSRDEATFLEAATRLLEDFGTQQILNGVRKAFAGVQSISSLSVVIERLSRHPESIGLIGPFVDAIGLLAWDVEHISKLRERISASIAAIEGFSVTDSVITELFDSVGVEPSENAIPSVNELQARSQKKLANRSQNDVVAKYSVETLVL